MPVHFISCVSTSSSPTAPSDPHTREDKHHKGRAGLPQARHGTWSLVYTSGPADRQSRNSLSKFDIKSTRRLTSKIPNSKVFVIQLSLSLLLLSCSYCWSLLSVGEKNLFRRSVRKIAPLPPPSGPQSSGKLLSRRLPQSEICCLMWLLVM